MPDAPTPYAEAAWCFDLHYLGHPHLIATGVLDTPEGLVLVDPGPETAQEALREQLRAMGSSIADLHAVLLTHIHLDHAGATGALVAEQPDLKVFVHEIGARHMVAPERLLRSAERLYGDDMERLWGTMRPVPKDNVQALAGGEMLRFGRRAFRVDYTPGHAIHHVSYLDEATGTAFAGDAAGMRVPGETYVMPQTPPPDVHLGHWEATLDVLRGWRAEHLFVTHCGPSGDVERHLDAMHERLLAWGEEVRERLDEGEEVATLAEAFHEEKMEEVEAQVSSAAVDAYDTFGSPKTSVHGLARYWKKKQARTAASS